MGLFDQEKLSQKQKQGEDSRCGNRPLLGNGLKGNVGEYEIHIIIKYVWMKTFSCCLSLSIVHFIFILQELDLDCRLGWLMGRTKAQFLLNEGLTHTLPIYPGPQIYIAQYIDCLLESFITIVVIIINVVLSRKYAHHGWHVGLRKSGQVKKLVF